MSAPDTAVFAMGCFWQPDEFFRKVEGVLATEVGYTGGSLERPSYEDVCGGDSGHAEAVRITYDPARISYRRLLELFWNNHDPTTLNRQGPDEGEQYRSAVFTLGAEQERLAREGLGELAHQGSWGAAPVVTEIQPLKQWWPAEDYHQKYLARRGILRCHLPSPPRRPLQLPGA